MLCVNWQFWLEKYFLHNLSLRWVARSISYVRSTPSTMHYEGAAVCVCRKCVFHQQYVELRNHRVALAVTQ